MSVCQDASGSSLTAGFGFSRCSCIAVPPLRARASDILPLALHAATASAALRGYARVELSHAAQLQLQGYDFPGNTEELQGLMPRAVMLHPVSNSYRSPNTSLSSSSSEYSLGCSSRSDTCSGSCKGESTSNGSSKARCGGGGCSTAAAAAGEVLLLDTGDFYGVAVSADRQRHDVMTLLRWMRGMLESGLWPYGLFKMVQWVFPLLVASLLLGPQVRQALQTVCQMGNKVSYHLVW
jgi:hypothetical protein